MHRTVTTTKVVQDPRSYPVPAILLFALILATPLVSLPGAWAQTHVWSQSFGAAGFDGGQSVVFDGGDVVVVGRFENTVDFGGGPLVSAGSSDLIVAKYDATGAHLWSKRFGGTGAEQPNDVHVDGSGNIIVSGAFQDTVDFGGGALVSAGANDVYLLKLDSAGSHIWSKRFGTVDNEASPRAAVDPSDNVILVGDLFNTVDFGGGPLVSAGAQDAFIAKFDASGTHLWSQRFGSTAIERPQALVTDSFGAIIVGYRFNGTASFGGASFVSAGNFDIALAKYDANGTHLWSQHFGGTSRDLALSLAVDTSDNIHMGGAFGSTVDFGGGPLVSGGSDDGILAKYDTNGSHIWSHRFGGSSLAQFSRVAVDGAGGIVVAGRFQGTGDFGGGGLTSAGLNDTFLARYDANGTHVWSQRFGGNDNDQPFGVAVDAFGATAMTGRFSSGAVDFGGGPLANGGDADFFLAKYQATPVPAIDTTRTLILALLMLAAGGQWVLLRRRSARA